ncbi:hypothetical protein [Lederbergia citrea]|nr:hypothetical protein [Lederbergia citrea]
MISKIGAVYQVIPEDQNQIQQYMNQTGNQNPVTGHSDQLYQ